MNNQMITPNANHNISSIGRLLLEMGKISLEDTERILRKQHEEGIKFGDAAKLLGLITEDDLQFALSQQFEYAYLPSSNLSYSRDLVAAYEPFSPQVEGFRALRSQLLFRWINEGFKAISIISANENEGCSYLASNLAVVFSQLGKKTLLVDGNMRKPRLHQIFNIKQTYGLSDILADRAPGPDTLSVIPEMPNLTVLCAGTVPPNPQELIGRSNFTQLIKYASSMFDVIILDTPALSVSSDAQMYASITRGAVLSSRLDHTSISEITNLKALVQSAGASVIGLVVNKF
ncbi:MAG: chain length determinant protein tyrosine kinase EpsG [Methylophilus methylotrophus]|uniref:Chain length determinant protein tyrosine kinase EpsG n=1 Tax=Methylophilus methylotrophus TaxID=17 RepID=A0A5C7WHG0_METME|nr:MAG: chain length determinant protein tyrosine kinase EpsG [Methylophilus methylotrophus]